MINYSFRVTDGSSSISESGWESPHHEKSLTNDETIEYQRRFRDLHTEFWHHEYVDQRVLDGTQWSLNVTYTNGRCYSFEGSKGIVLLVTFSRVLYPIVLPEIENAWVRCVSQILPSRQNLLKWSCPALAKDMMHCFFVKMNDGEFIIEEWNDALLE